MRMNKIALYSVSLTSHEWAPVGLCSPPPCMIDFVSKKISRGEMEIDEEHTSDTTLRPNLHLATMKINDKNCLHQFFSRTGLLWQEPAQSAHAVEGNR